MKQINFTREHNCLAAARQLDRDDELAGFRAEFSFPTNAAGEPLLYFAGHSLGLMPRRAREAVSAECDNWGKYAVNPHISPMDAKITPDLCFQRVPATESIAVTMVEGAGTRWEHKDK